MKSKTKKFSIGWADLSTEKQQEIIAEVEKLVLKRWNSTIRGGSKDGLELMLKKEAIRSLAESI